VPEGYRHIRAVICVCKAEDGGVTLPPRFGPLPVSFLFPPVIDGNPGRAAGRRSRAFPVVILELTGKPQAPVVPGLLFFSCCLQENRGTEWVEPRARSLIAASCLAMLAAVRGDDGVHKPPGRRGGYP